MSIQQIITGSQLGIWSKTFRDISYRTVKAYTPKQLQALVREASHTKVLGRDGNIVFSLTSKLANAVFNFSDCVFRGLKKLYPGKNIKFISIGQSPAVIAEALNVKGMDTAICPISKLAKLKDKQLREIALSPKFNQYLAYIKNAFGLDLLNIDKTKKYVFCDYTATGNSLNNFKQLLNYRGLLKENMEFVALQDLVKHGDDGGKSFQKVLWKNSENQKEARSFVEKFILFKLENCQLKNYCSPIFKLDALHLDEAPKNIPSNPVFNKLKIMLYNIFLNGGTNN